jgi:hypothetical protein
MPSKLFILDCSGQSEPGFISFYKSVGTILMVCWSVGGRRDAGIKDVGEILSEKAGGGRSAGRFGIDDPL